MKSAADIQGQWTNLNVSNTESAKKEMVLVGFETDGPCFPLKKSFQVDLKCKLLTNHDIVVFFIH